MSIPNPPVPERAAAASAAALPPPGVVLLPQWTSAALLKGAREVVIDHQGALYRLRLTASGKLILTK